MSNTLKFVLVALIAGISGGVGSYFLNSYLPRNQSSFAVVDLKKIIGDRQTKLMLTYNKGGKLDDAAAAALAKEVKSFSERLSAVLEKESEKRTLFVKNAVIAGPTVDDITDKIAETLK